MRKKPSNLCIIPHNKKWAVKKDTCKRPIVICKYKYQAIHIAEQLTICENMPSIIKIGLIDRLFNKAKYHYIVNWKHGKIIRTGLHKFIMKLVPVFTAPLRVGMDYKGIAKKLLQSNDKPINKDRLPVYDKDLPKRKK